MTDTNEYNIGWKFDNSYARLPETFYRNQNPSPVNSPKQVLLNRELALSLGLNFNSLESVNGTAELSGNRLPDGAYPIAQAYAGHQFGYFTMLGDGRVLLLGEQMSPNGERFDIQLKGSGRTPYSRGGDGRAALGPMLREYIISEAMHTLGISTTRSLSVVITGDSVYRETVLPGAVLTRVAPSHIRIGTFQYASKWSTATELKILADYTIHRHFPEYVNAENKYLNFLKEVVRLQAMLIAKWQLVGFIHGVMNTDNMALSGETIDYGPCAFMDTYDPETVFSSIDYQGRYAYGNQPNIAVWNLAQFADTLLPLIHSDRAKSVELTQNIISDFSKIYNSYWLTGMRAKLGLTAEENEDTILIDDLLKLMHMYRADYTNTFLALTFNRSDDSALFHNSEFTKWHRKWKMRLDREPDKEESAVQLMKNSNPAVIPRNHRVEEALDAAVKYKDYSVTERLLNVLSKPYAHIPDQTEYAAVPTVSSCSYKTFCGT